MGKGKGEELEIRISCKKEEREGERGGFICERDPRSNALSHPGIKRPENIRNVLLGLSSLARVGKPWMFSKIVTCYMSQFHTNSPFVPSSFPLPCLYSFLFFLFFFFFLQSAFTPSLSSLHSPFHTPSGIHNQPPSKVHTVSTVSWNLTLRS